MQKLNRNGEKLFEFIWFSLCFHFAHRGREGWQELTTQSFEIKTDDTGACYVTEKLTEQTKNYQGDAERSEQSYPDVQLIQWLHLNFTKTHPNCKALFETPNKATTKNMNFASARHWY